MTSKSQRQKILRAHHSSLTTMGDFQANFHRPDSGINTVEGNVAGPRAANLEKKRQRDQEEFEERKRKITADAAKHTSIHSKFAGGTGCVVERSFKSKTVGLVSAADFIAAAAEAEKPVEDVVLVESAEERAAREKAAKKARKRKLKEKRKIMSTLSFAGDEEAQDLLEDLDDDNDDGGGDAAVDQDDAKEKTGATTVVTSMKNPAVDTSFLPDKARDEQVVAERIRLEKEWKEQQEAIKKEKLQITYSYWDGSGHRRQLVCVKGDTVGDFLEQVRKDLCGSFKELNNIAADALVYVKEDLIIPQDLTFYDLIATKARGKSGPLFNFDVHDDIRIGAIDSRIEKDESHPGKVVERRWYERNKHIFPASRWELYDPVKDYGGYTIHGGELNNNKKKN
jgi:protein FAM50